MIKFSLFFLLIISTASSDFVSEYEELIFKINADPELHEDFDNNVKYALSLDENYINHVPNTKFNCKVKPTESFEATNVHELTPSDIKVVAALGDSITAGVGAEAITPLGLLIENRKMSWSIGGAKDLSKHITLPNFLKQYNKEIIGYSTKDTLVLAEHQELNEAVSGNRARGVLAQAERLVKDMKASKSINFEKDWKLVTLFIGGNNLCQYCEKKGEHEPINYINSIKKAFDYLHAELPRALVNFVSMVNVEDIRDMNNGLVCGLLHVFLCPCAAYPINEKAILTLESYFQNYTRLSRELVESGRYDTKDDFTVVLQPFFSNFKAPRLDNGKVDLSYFAPDCFHYSAKSHALAAIGLWNNMLQPVGKKQTTLSLDEQPICPSEEHPYIYTSKNSK